MAVQLWVRHKHCRIYYSLSYGAWSTRHKLQPSPNSHRTFFPNSHTTFLKISVVWIGWRLSLVGHRTIADINYTSTCEGTLFGGSILMVGSHSPGGSTVTQSRNSSMPARRSDRSRALYATSWNTWNSTDSPALSPATLSYSVSQPPPPEIFWHFIRNDWEFLVQILHAYYTFLSTLDYTFYSIICKFDEVMPY